MIRFRAGKLPDCSLLFLPRIGPVDVKTTVVPKIKSTQSSVIGLTGFMNIWILA